MAQAGGFSLVQAAFLGGGTPDLADSVSNLIAAGAERVVVIPYFLTLGLHLQRDLPELVAEVRQKFPELTSLEVTEPLDGHPALTTILLDRAVKAL
jgi:sirohydrochlorin ferrochelatase